MMVAFQSFPLPPARWWTSDGTVEGETNLHTLSGRTIDATPPLPSPVHDLADLRLAHTPSRCTIHRGVQLMQTNPVRQPALRLVGCPDPTALDRWHEEVASREAVAQENAATQTQWMATSDPRWVLAMAAHARMGRGVIGAHGRDRLMAMGRGMGLRPFDAALVVAIAQDHSRRGVSIQEASGVLSLVTPPQPASPSWRSWFIAAVLAAGIVGGVAVWLAAH